METGLDSLKQKLILAGRILDLDGQGDFTRGHVSARLPDDPSLFLMKPHSYGLEEITAENLVTCNLAGEKVAGGGARHSEVFIHSEIFKARPDIGCIIHTHPVHAVALSATGRALMPISQPSVLFSDGLPYYTDTIDLIRTPEMGAGVAGALGSAKAMLMRNHGVAVVGATVDEAVVLTLALEEACKIQLLAEAAGGAGAMFPPDDIARLHDKITKPEQYRINFDYLCRRAERLMR